MMKVADTDKLIREKTISVVVADWKPVMIL